MAEDGQARARIAAAGDVHMRPGLERRFGDQLEELDGAADLLLVAGDLTATGAIDEGEALARALRRAPIAVVAVLGNHDCNLDHHAEIAALLEHAGVHVLGRGRTHYVLPGGSVGVAGTKGFVGGFRESRLPDFGEPLLRQVYGETSAEADAIARGLQAIVHCDVRIVLLHYAPVLDTLEGEPPGIYTYLGSERLARPIAENGADLVLHGHAHAGSFQGCIGDIPVYNVAVHVTGRNFWIVELDGSGVRRGGEVVEVREPQQ